MSPNPLRVVRNIAELSDYLTVNSDHYNSAHISLVDLKRILMERMGKSLQEFEQIVTMLRRENVWDKISFFAKDENGLPYVSCSLIYPCSFFSLSVAPSCFISLFDELGLDFKPCC